MSGFSDNEFWSKLNVSFPPITNLKSIVEMLQGMVESVLRAEAEQRAAARCDVADGCALCQEGDKRAAMRQAMCGASLRMRWQLCGAGIYCQGGI